MYQIAIIGAGQLGSRHLQGALKINIPANIQVVDLNKQSLEIAEQRANEIEHGREAKNISYITSISDLNDDIDICIVATTANVRYAVLSQLIPNKRVKNLVLEKVLFQKMSEYSLTQALLDEHNVKCWVNCPRRLMPVYKEIKSLIKPAAKITYTVLGSNWGLACNAIHFIDHLNFLNGTDDFTYDTTGIYEIVEGKRAGNYEFLGSVLGKSNGSELFLHSRGNDAVGLKIQILTDDYIWQIDEANKLLVTYSLLNNWKPVISEFDFYYQSQLTNLVCEDIILNGRSGLTEYSVSSKLHQDMIRSFTTLFNKKTGNNVDYCPIT